MYFASTARIKELNCGKELIFPVWPDGFHSLWKPEKYPKTIYRNIIAWYLKAAGFTGKEIGCFLSISSSRANQLALVTKNKFKHLVSGLDIASMRRWAKIENLENDSLAAHMLSGVRNEMMAAEYCLNRCAVQADHYVVSSALRLGREAYSAMFDKIVGARCPCRLCANGVYPKSLDPYWIKNDKAD